MEDIKLIILDRDGVINEDSPEYIKSPAEWHAIPGGLDAISRLNKAGFKVVVATNQSGLARGYYTQQVLDKIHEKMRQELAEYGGHLDGIFICPHEPEDNCECRKPKPGLLIKIGKKFNIPPEQTINIGDSLRDIEATKAYGAKAVLVLTGNGTQTLRANPELEDVLVYDDLAEAAKEIIGYD